MTPPPDLHEVPPREQVGAPTGQRFEFQYHQAAARSLELLDESLYRCVFCEWHDDYVVEYADGVRYRFYQVKTRELSRGPWKFRDFFGVSVAGAGGRAGQVSVGSTFHRLYEHVETFGDGCDGFELVTNAGVEESLAALINTAKAVTTHSQLQGREATNFISLHSRLQTGGVHISEESLFGFLRRFTFTSALGEPTRLRICLYEMSARIRELSEVDLTGSQAEKIGADLVGLVREKSHRRLEVLPSSMEELRRIKGVQLDEVLDRLSLSPAGYRELRSVGRDAVVALSRLQRVLNRHGVPEALVPELCSVKSEWDRWFVSERHANDAIELITLKSECAASLRVIEADRTRDFFSAALHEAKAIAERFRPALSAGEPLTETHVFGLLLSLTIEAAA